MRTFWGSLRLRLILLVIIATIPALALILYSGWEGRRQAALDSQAQALRLARIASTQQQHVLDETRWLLMSLAEIPSITNGDAAGCTDILTNLLKSYPLYTNLAVNTPEGGLLCSGTPAPPGVVGSVSDRKYLQAAVQTRQFAYGDYVIGRLSGKPALLTGLPVLDSAGNVKLVLHAGIDLSWLNTFAASVGMPPGSWLTVAKRDGTLLIRYPEPEKWVGKQLPDTKLVASWMSDWPREGAGEGPTDSGLDRIYGFTGLDGSDNPDVYVCFAIPASVAYADAYGRLERNLVGLSVAVLLVLVMAWFGSDLFLLRRLQALVRASQRLAGGDLAARSGIHGDRGELGQLGRAFDDMAASLEARSAERLRAESERGQLLEEIERERATLSGILASMSQGVIMVEPNSKVSYCSARAGGLLGIHPELVVGRSVDGVLAHARTTWDLDESVLPDWERLRMMVPHSPTFELSIPGPPPRDLSFDVFAVAEQGAQRGFGLLIRDVTAERHAARTKDSVISTVSHELRTPLSSIRSYSEMLLYYDDPAVRKEFLEIINAESERLTRLLNEVLDLATIESGKVVWNLTAIDLPALVRDCIHVYLPFAREHQLALIADIEEGLPPITGDADRLRQVLNNLLDNAIKFTDRGQIVVAAQRVNGEVRISIADSGVGIPPDDLERVFERFHQGGTSVTGKPRGIGLGLSICSEIVRRCGGRIWAESTPGHGSTFTVALPCLSSPPSPPALLPSPASARGSYSRRFPSRLIAAQPLAATARPAAATITSRKPSTNDAATAC
jgi:signal transduction histidine kinase